MAYIQRPGKRRQFVNVHILREDEAEVAIRFYEEDVGWRDLVVAKQSVFEGEAGLAECYPPDAMQIDRLRRRGFTYDQIASGSVRSRESVRRQHRKWLREQELRNRMAVQPDTPEMMYRFERFGQHCRTVKFLR